MSGALASGAPKLRVGIVHHLGWAVAVTAHGHRVVDRRRIDLIEAGVPPAPIEHEIQPLENAAAAKLVARVRTSAARATDASLNALASAVPGAIVSLSLRAWPLDFPEEIPVLRRAPYMSQADSVMYRQVLAELAQKRGWTVHLYEARSVQSQAARGLGSRAEEVLYGPRDLLGPPWTRDHREALSAAILAAGPTVPRDASDLRPLVH